MHGHIGAGIGLRHGHPQVRRHQGRCIVDAVTHKGHHMALGMPVAHRLRFVAGQHAGLHLLRRKAQLGRHSLRRDRAVAREHAQLQATRTQGVQVGFRTHFDGVTKRQQGQSHGGGTAFGPQQRHAVALLLVRLHKGLPRRHIHA